jgi:hypothetical protein
MAWRIDENISHGELDFTTRGRVLGHIWFVGASAPAKLDLTGIPARDLAGLRLTFTNPAATLGPPPHPNPLGPIQRGQAGEMTASRKVRVPDCPMQELLEYVAQRQPFPWHWGNALYLEWFSKTHGRVVIEAAHYQLELNTDPTWQPSPEEEARQLENQQNASAAFMENLAHAATLRALDSGNPLDPDDDAPQSAEEAAADAENARMNLIFDRIDARIARGEISHADFQQAYQQERARLKKELGEAPDTEPSAREIEERQHWIEEMNAIAREALEDLKAEDWKEHEDEDEEDNHPLVVACVDWAVDLHRQIDESGWLPSDAGREHPIMEILDGATIAASKLAGAFAMGMDEPWPPDPFIAGNVLVRLKKARNCLRDTLNALDSADQENLATPAWRQQTRLQTAAILAQVQQHIDEAREVLRNDDTNDD